MKEKETDLLIKSGLTSQTICEYLGPVSQRVAINRRFSFYTIFIELRLISIVRLIVTLCETGPRELYCFRLQSFTTLVQLGCDRIADFICILFAPPCVQVRDVSVPVPPCRHVCEEARDQCSPYLQVVGVSWPEQFECSIFPEIADGSVQCAEPEMSKFSSKHFVFFVLHDYGLLLLRDVNV